MAKASKAVPLPPVLLIHGWGGSFESTWKRNGWCQALRVAGRKVIAVDLLGHGVAAASHDSNDYADLATSVEASLKKHPLIDAIGFSLGGKVLLELACRLPGRFRRIVIAGLGQNVFAPERTGGMIASVLERGVRGDDPPAVRAIIRQVEPAGNDPLALAACLRRPPNPVLTPERLAGVTCPVHLIAGEEDSVAQPIAPLQQALRYATLENLPGIDHFELPGSLTFRVASLAFLANLIL